MKKQRVCIIGAGISGLMAGALLVREGHTVSIFEKAVTVGGSAGWYARKNRMYPTGATIAFGLESGGMLHRLLNRVGAFEKLKIRTLTHPMDVLLPDRRIAISLDEQQWYAELSRVFHERADDVLRFWRKLKQISLAVEGVTSTEVALPIRSFVDVGNLPTHLLRHLGQTALLARYALVTVEHLLRQYRLHDYAPFRTFLNAQLVDAAQTDIRHAALLPSAVALDIYRRGSFSIEGGLASISKALAEVIAEAGGAIYTANTVKKCVLGKYNGRDVWRVESAKRADECDVLLNASGLSLTSIDGSAFQLQADRNETWSEQWGAFRIDAILNDVRIEEPLPFAWQIVPNPEHSQLFGDEFGPVYFTMHESRDANGDVVAGEVMLTASVHTSLQQWRGLDKVSYLQRKQAFTDAILNEFAKVIPHAKECLQTLYSGSPMTYDKFIGKFSVGGRPLTVKHAMRSPKGYRTAIDSLFLAGEQVFPGPGTLSCALSGFYAARAIIKRFK